MNKKLKIAVFACLIIGATSYCWAETINLSWNAPEYGGAVEGYYLYYGMTDNISSMTKLGPINSTNYMLDLNNAGSIKYYFYVRAFNAAGEGPASPVKVVGIHLQIIPQE